MEQLYYNFILNYMEQSITIFNCENNKYFISNTPPLNYFKERPKHYEISTFVNMCCNPRIKQYDFVQINKIISIKKIKSISIDSKSMRQFSSAKDYIDYNIDRAVFIYMYKYGIENVRGGSYTDLELPLLTKQFIMNEWKKIFGLEDISKQKVQQQNAQSLNAQQQMAQQQMAQPLNAQQQMAQPLNAQPLNAQPQQENYDLETLFEDLYKITHYEEIISLTTGIDDISINTIRLYVVNPNTHIQMKHPIFTGNRMQSIYKKISAESNFTKYLIRKNLHYLDDLTSMYLFIKAELIHMKSELAKLNSKYGSIENLQNMINKEISNLDNISSNEKLPFAIPVYSDDLSNLGQKL